MKLAPHISVVLPNYNGRKLLEANLPSLFAALRATGDRYEVIVADDASGDDSVAYLEARGDVTVLRQPRNLGFSSTCNLGIAHANGEFCCVVNTDVRFGSDYFKVILAELATQGGDFACGPIHNYRDDPAMPHSIDRRVKLVQYRGLLRSFPERKAIVGEHQTTMRLGCCFVARTAALRALGGYDELFSPYYWEDVDLAWRAERAGHHLVLVDEARVFHQESSTVKSLRHPRRHLETVVLRNQILMTWRWLRRPAPWLRHGAWMGFFLLTRWLVLDFHFYPALLQAWKRRGAVNRVPAAMTSLA